MTSVVHYRFKSMKDYSSVRFDGPFIYVSDLKRAIVEQKQLGAATDQGLEITNESTEEVYERDRDKVPRNTSVIVRRITVHNRNHSLAAYAPSGTSTVTDTRTMGAASGMGGNASATAPQMGQVSKGVLQVATRAPQQMGKEMSEEERIAAVMGQASQQYGAPTLADRQRLTGQQRYQLQQQNRRRIQDPSVPPPDNYTCYRCGEKGHWIQFCPTHGDENYSKQAKAKKPLGIPTSFLAKVDDDKKDDTLTFRMSDGTVTAASIALTHVARSGGVKKYEGPIPEELKCPICGKAFREASMTGCCHKTYCDDCIRNKLLDNGMVCPNCSTPNQGPDTLEPDHEARGAVVKLELGRYNGELADRLKKDGAAGTVSNENGDQNGLSPPDRDEDAMSGQSPAVDEKEVAPPSADVIDVFDVQSKVFNCSFQQAKFILNPEQFHFWKQYIRKEFNKQRGGDGRRRYRDDRDGGRGGYEKRRRY
eukprot:Clim_evm102s149 gene=Clim_evmTU102s149